jgi:magnesium-transporting ATPase (P-type)
VIQLLNGAMIRSVMVTGDNPLTAINVAQKCLIFPNPTTPVYLVDIADSSKKLTFTYVPPPSSQRKEKVLQEVYSSHHIITHCYMQIVHEFSWLDENTELAVTGKAYAHLTDEEPELLDKVECLVENMSSSLCTGITQIKSIRENVSVAKSKSDREVSSLEFHCWNVWRWC